MNMSLCPKKGTPPKHECRVLLVSMTDPRVASKIHALLEASLARTATGPSRVGGSGIKGYGPWVCLAVRVPFSGFMTPPVVFCAKTLPYPMVSWVAF